MEGGQLDVVEQFQRGGGPYLLALFLHWSIQINTFTTGGAVY
jgi:hypothetical protein